MLDPEGDCVLSEELVRVMDMFIVGGIVDKERRVKGETARLYRLLRLNVPRCRIELRGSIIGVPDRINKVIEIILMTLFETGSIEEAIIRPCPRGIGLIDCFMSFRGRRIDFVGRVAPSW